jgi:hypothetical protein
MRAARRIESGGSFLASGQERKVAGSAAVCHSGTVSDAVRRENLMGAFSGTPVNPGGPYREHREVPRFTLIASIELREPNTDTRISGRISEISRKGCYVDVLITLPEGTGLDVRISRDQGVFETKGKIVYVQHGMGMGVTFIDPAPEQLQLLDTWLAEISS